MVDHLIGVISDTHGLLRTEAVQALHGVDLIIHAGDVGSPDVLEELQRIAPVIAVRGNVDRGAWANKLRITQVAQVGGHSIFVLHDFGTIDLDPHAAGFSAVIFGHSHQPYTNRADGVLYMNPGSAGPKRFKLPVSVGLLRISECSIDPNLIYIE